MTDKKRIGRQGAKQKKIQKNLYDLICSRHYRPMRAKDIAVLLDVPKAGRKDMLLALDVLEAEKKIEVNSRGCYQKRINRNRLNISAGQEKGTARDADMTNGVHEHRKESGRETVTSAQLITESLTEMGIVQEFPRKVLDQADRCPDGPIDGDFYGRSDLRTQLCITIDGDDSRDFDDAVSLTREGSGYILGVHIADVTNYVQDGSALDREALRRGTSVYLPDRVIPMLPEKLSNGTCSLNEGEDRLTLSCIMKYDREGNLTQSKIIETVICSAHRMTYQEVDRIFEEKPRELMEKYADVVPMLFAMKELAEILTAGRASRGMIDFDFPETRFELSESGHPLRVYPKYPTPATRLIEQFMLSANETVAKTYADRQIPFLYRCHENPDEEKMERTLTLIREMGIPAEKKGKNIQPLEVRSIIQAADGTEKEKMIGMMLLRSMQQARYTPDDCRHFGLAAPYYCHFTSPIRRYPDLQIHRIIKDDLRGRLNERKTGYYRRILDDIGWKSSALERTAAEAERNAVKIKMAEYALDHIGEAYDAVISGVTEWGFYVQTPDTMEGLVHVSTLKDDFYHYEEERMCLIGKDSGRIFEMGQTVQVKLWNADIARHIIDFELMESKREE